MSDQTLRLAVGAALLLHGLSHVAVIVAVQTHWPPESVFGG